MALATIGGCKAQNPSIIAGVYSANYGETTELLSLDPGGGFTQTVEIHPSGQRATSHGKWHLDTPSGFVIFDSGYLEVRDMLGRLRPDYSEPLKGLVDMPAVTCLGHVYLGTGEFVLYQKESPAFLSATASFCRAIL
jgi:hypothetical protein